MPSKIRTRKNSNNLDTPKNTKDIKNLRKYSAAESTLLKLNRMENLRDRIESSISLNPKISSRKHSCMDSDGKSDFAKTLRKFEVLGEKSEVYKKKGHLRCKSHSIDNLNSLSFLSPFDDCRPKSRLQKVSGISQMTRPSNSRAKSNQR